MDLDVGEFLDSLQLNNLKDIFEKERASSMKRLENKCTDFKRAKYIRRGGFEFANSAHIMKPFRKSRVQFVSDAFAFVSDCQCVLLPRSLGMCLSTWAMTNLKIGIHAFGHRHKILKAVKEKLSGLPELGK